MRLAKLLVALLFVGGAVALIEGTSAHAGTRSAAELFELPTDAGHGEAKEVEVLVDETHLKLATITLRDGESLPTHSTPVPATIQVVSGEGVITVEGEPMRVSAGSVVVLAPEAEHDVVPIDGANMVLVVHYLKSAIPVLPPTPSNQQHGDRDHGKTDDSDNSHEHDPDDGDRRDDETDPRFPRR